MKRSVVWIAMALIAIVLGYVASATWWGLWMDQGWPGPPGILVAITHAGGEAHYDAVQYEMWFLCALLIFVVLVAIKAWLKRREKALKSSQ